MKKFWILAAILIALVAINSWNQSEEEAEEKTSFSGEVAKISGVDTASRDAQFKAPQEAASKSYMDETSGFRITFPDSWKDFRVETNMIAAKDGGSKLRADFGGWKPNVHYLFSLLEEPKNTYQQTIKASDGQGDFTMTYVGEAGKSGDAILCFGVCCKGGDGLDEYSAFESRRCTEVPDILKTFESLE